VLTVTGGEALYADMGHFGRKPIRMSWFGLVFPTLMLNYLGQGAYLLSGAPVSSGNVFYSIVPRVAIYPMVGLATLATIIASQALISGAFSLTSQGIGLGLFPRMRIVHTHHAQEGQIYVPFINWALFAGCILVVLGFRSSSALAAAYGLAESGVMLATSLGMLFIARLYWKWMAVVAFAMFGAFACIDSTFLFANALKFFEGGFVPLILGIVIFIVMTTWRWGRKVTFSGYSAKKTMTMEELVALKRDSSGSLERNALLMVPKPLRAMTDNTPALMQLLWDRHGVLPKNLIFVEVIHLKVPYIHDNRYEVTTFFRDADKGTIMSVAVAFGFMEDPNVELLLEDLAGHHEIDLPADPHLWTVHVSLENVLLSKTAKLFTRFRLRLFMLLRQMSQPAYYFYGLGNDIHLSAEVFPVRLE
jgi:KUP system potassium uptake protein